MVEEKEKKDCNKRDAHRCFCISVFLLEFCLVVFRLQRSCLALCLAFRCLARHFISRFLSDDPKKGNQ